MNLSLIPHLIGFVQVRQAQLDLETDGWQRLRQRPTMSANRLELIHTHARDIDLCLHPDHQEAAVWPAAGLTFLRQQSSVHILQQGSLHTCI